VRVAHAIACCLAAESAVVLRYGCHVFRNRRDAGRTLAGLLRHYRGHDDVIVLALTRGCVPVGYEVAMALAAPLDVFLVRKLGVPRQEDLAMGRWPAAGWWC